MPFRSSAQARYMYARHPQIARRWTEEMRGKRGYAKEHPIKAAALPRHVEKSIVGSLLRRAPKEPGPILRSGITRMGRVGVEFEHKGVKGWGVNEEAARMAWQQNHASRYTSGVAKGIARQSVKPLLARRAQLAATAARPVRTNPGAVIGKGFGNEALKMVKTGREVASSDWKAGRTGTKPRMSLGTAVAATNSSAMRGIGQAAQAAGQRPVITGLVGGGILGGLANHEVTKAYGDPEDARYTRLGAEAAGLGIGGAGGVGYAAYDTRRATRLTRPGARFAANNLKHAKKVTVVEGRGKNKVEREVKMISPRLKAYGSRLGRSGYTISRRGGMAGAGGLSALGGAEALRRRANERRWN